VKEDASLKAGAGRGGKVLLQEMSLMQVMQGAFGAKRQSVTLRKAIVIEGVPKTCHKNTVGMKYGLLWYVGGYVVGGRVVGGRVVGGRGSNKVHR
jgi:hypothetical protein